MPLSQVDELICEHLAVPVSERTYAFGWFDSIGLMLAIGKTFDDVIADDDFSGPMREIACFLRDNFTSHAWYQRN